MKNPVFMSAVILSAAVLMIACTPGAQSEPPEPTGEVTEGPIPVEPETLPLITQTAPQTAVEEALLTGTLEYDENGCWRVSDEGGSFLIIWPNGFTATARIGAPQVLDENGEVVGTIGMEIKLGGGAREGETAAGFEEEHPDLPSDQCPGPYWVVGDIVQ